MSRKRKNRNNKKVLQALRAKRSHGGPHKVPQKKNGGGRPDPDSTVVAPGESGKVTTETTTTKPMGPGKGSITTTQDVLTQPTGEESAAGAPKVQINLPDTPDVTPVKVAKIIPKSNEIARATSIAAQPKATQGTAKVQEAAAMYEDVEEADLPDEITAATFDATFADPTDETEAAQGTVSKKAVADPKEVQRLRERAKAATRDARQEKAALAGETDFEISDGAYVDKVTGKRTDTAPTKEAERNTRRNITGSPAPDGVEAVIDKNVGYEAAQRRKVKGDAARGGAADMLAATADLPPDITAAVVEDPASVEAQIDDQPVEVRAAVAALPTEALVSTQMETLLSGMEDGKTPLWARPAVAAVEQNLARRGLSVSSVGRDALFNAIIQTALPMAQSNAQALQARAAQNLSNQQQANLAQSTQDMQRRMANLANRQTAESQSASNAQAMATLQSQFRQQAVLTSEQSDQQLRVQNLANLQQEAVIRSQNEQATRSQNLSNEQQMELANLQAEKERAGADQSAVNQERLAEMQVAADFLARNAGFKQQMELANLSNDQQMRLANLTALNQAESQRLTANQQTELANLNTRLQTNLLEGKLAAQMGIAQLSADQQRAVQNASMVARVDLTKFSADQQVELANSRFMQSMTMADFNAEQQAAMQNATAMAQLDLATVDQRTKVAISNAQSFLKMDMANLNNRQQAVILDQQMLQQRLLSDQAADNAAKQFNAVSENQTNQFLSSLEANMNQYNTTQINSMAQFNASEVNKIDALNANNATEVSKFNAQLKTNVSQFNANIEFQRDQWVANNKAVVQQSNIEWRRSSNTINTAAQNAANQKDAERAFNLDAAEMSVIWQNLRDEANYIRQSYENEQQRKTTLYATSLANEAAADKGSSTSAALLELAARFLGIS